MLSPFIRGIGRYTRSITRSVQCNRLMSNLGTIFRPTKVKTELPVFFKSSIRSTKRFLTTKENNTSRIEQNSITARKDDLNTHAVSASASSSALSVGLTEPVTMQFLESLLPDLALDYKLLSEDDKNKIIEAHPLGPYWSKQKRLPMNPITGEIDFRFLDDIFLEDLVIERLLNFKPSDYVVVLLQAISGAGKTGETNFVSLDTTLPLLKVIVGSIFALAKKHFVLYTEAVVTEGNDLDYKDRVYIEHQRHSRPLRSLIKARKMSPELATSVMICSTQLLWLSQAILLHKMQEKHKSALTPEIWMAFLMNEGGYQAAQINKKFQMWFLQHVREADLDHSTLYQQIEVPLDDILAGLTKDKVFFAVDEAQAAQHTYNNIPIVNSEGKSRTFLSVLVNYSLPVDKSVVITGTRMTKYDDTKSGESKTNSSFFTLREFKIDYPIVTKREAFDFVAQYFDGKLAGMASIQDAIGQVAQGRIRRSANLTKFIWDANNTGTAGLTLDEMIVRGIDALKFKIERYVFNRLNQLDAEFKKDTLKAKKWKALLLELFYGSSLSDEFEMDEQPFITDLGVNIEDLGFALVHSQLDTQPTDSDRQDQRKVSIKEPYSFSVFRLWLLSSGYKPYVVQYERDLQKAVEGKFYPQPNMKGICFEQLIGTSMLLFDRKNLTLSTLPIINDLSKSEPLPNWLQTQFRPTWNFFGSAEKCDPLQKAADLLRKANMQADFTTLQTYFAGSIFQPLFRDNSKVTQVKEAMVAILACEEDYHAELICLLTQYSGGLIQPSQYLGPDIIGFSDGVLFLASVYLYSATTSTAQKEKLNRKKLSVAEWYSPSTKGAKENKAKKCKDALNSILKVSTWNQIGYDVGVPRTESKNEIGSSYVHVAVSQVNVEKLVANPEAVNKVLQTLGIVKQLKEKKKRGRRSQKK